MALSTPVTIRTTEEAKQLFYSLSEQSDTESNGDFFKAVLDFYNLDQAKKETSVLQPTIDTIQQLFTQINNCLIGASTNIKANADKYASQLAEEKKSFNETIQLLQNKINSLEEKILVSDKEISTLHKENEDLHARIKDQNEQLNQFNAIISNKNDIIEEYKQKNIENSKTIQSLLKENTEIENFKKEIEKINVEAEVRHQKEIITLSRENENKLNELIKLYGNFLKQNSQNKKIKQPELKQEEIQFDE